MKNNFKDYLPTAVAFVVTIVFFLFVCFNHKQTADALMAIMPQSPWVCAVIILFCYIIQGIIPFFAYNPIVLACGLLFRLPTALTLNTFGTIICLAVPYEVGKRTHSKWVQKLLAKNKVIQNFTSGTNESSFILSYILRVLGFSNTILGFLFGSGKMPIRVYLISGFLGVLPGMLCFTILGSSWNWKSPLLWIILAADLCIAATAFFLYRKCRKIPTETAKIQEDIKEEDH
jgi:uncharacterized membrane protein YdjX (TVP38/TMEM64 family)